MCPASDMQPVPCLWCAYAISRCLGRAATREVVRRPMVLLGLETRGWRIQPPQRAQVLGGRRTRPPYRARLAHQVLLALATPAIAASGPEVVRTAVPGRAADQASGRASNRALLAGQQGAGHLADCRDKQEKPTTVGSVTWAHGCRDQRSWDLDLAHNLDPGVRREQVAGGVLVARPRLPDRQGHRDGSGRCAAYQRGPRAACQPHWARSESARC